VYLSLAEERVDGVLGGWLDVCLETKTVVCETLEINVNMTYIQHGSHQDNTEGIEVANNIVRDTVTGENSAQIVGRVANTIQKVSIHCKFSWEDNAYPLSFQYCTGKKQNIPVACIVRCTSTTNSSL
jgi:hypothetical protein